MSSIAESLPRPRRRTGWLLQAHYFLFAILVIGWTIALLVPVPKETAAVVLPTEDAIFWFGKSLHVATYAFLTALGVSLPLTAQQRLWIVIGFICHGQTTEYIQKFVNRGSSVRDAMLDSSGVFVGWGLWTWWTRSGRSS